MACAARAGPTTCALHLEVVGLSDIEQVVAIGYFEGVRLAVLVDECDFAPVSCQQNSTKAMASRARRTPRRAWADQYDHGGM